MAFVLHVANVQPDSIETLQLPRSLHLQFASMGSGYYPTHYAILVQLPDESDAELQIQHVEADASDENVVLKLHLSESCKMMPTSYLAGPDGNDLKEYTLGQYNDQQNSDDDESVKSLQVDMAHHEVEQALEVTIAPECSIKEAETEKQDEKEEHQEQLQQKKPNKKQRKRNKRSLSESACEEIKAKQQEQQKEQQEQEPPKLLSSEHIKSGSQPLATLKLPQRKQRSYSECCNDSSSVQRGILKRFSRYGPRPSMSDSCSSIDDCSSSYSCSVDAIGAGFSQSFGGIPEERAGGGGDGDNAGLSESCKKTVRFNDHIILLKFKNIFIYFFHVLKFLICSGSKKLGVSL